MSLRRASVIELLFACGLAACAKPAFVPSGVNVSSDRSEYSPTARLSIALAPLRLDGDTIDIVIDSGSITVPGELVGDTVAAMRNFYLTALLVVPRRAGRHGVASPSPWHAEAESDSLFVVEGLRFGERRALGAVRLRIPRPANLDPSRTWLVFRITGMVIPKVTRMEGQRDDVSAPRPQRFRVYACADWNLAGRIDRDRARQMRVAYLSAC